MGQTKQLKKDRQTVEKLGRKLYDKELARLQGELVRLQEWVVRAGLKVCIVFEGRDTAGKGGVIERITERVSPRLFRVVALPKPYHLTTTAPSTSEKISPAVAAMSPCCDAASTRLAKTCGMRAQGGTRDVAGEIRVRSRKQVGAGRLSRASVWEGCVGPSVDEESDLVAWDPPGLIRSTPAPF